MDIVKASFDVSFDNPCASREAHGDICECRYTASSGSKPVGAVAEFLLVDGFKEHFQSTLHYPILDGWDSQWPYLSIPFRDVHPTDWCRSKLSFL
jgi:hypothetical protein